jgi:transposase
MIQITPQMRILFAAAPVDFRRGIDGLAATCRAVLGEDPMTGALFVFRNRRGSALKLLVYDGQGYWLCLKRLSTGRFTWSPHDGAAAARRLLAHELQLLVWNGNPDAARAAPAWRPIAPADCFKNAW